MIRIVSAVILATLAPPVFAAEPNTWVEVDGGAIEGRRWDVPLGYSPDLKQFLVLGGRSNFADYKKPRSYDVLSFDPSGKWRNVMPAGKDWGPEFGPVSAPNWKDEYWGFRDTSGG